MHRNQPQATHGAPQQTHAGGSQTYFVQHDFEGSARLTTTLAHAISDVSGVDVTDAGFTLADHVDPDALDRLFRPKDDGTPRMDGQLSFSVWGYGVTVYSDGTIAVVPPQGSAPVQG